eukprot:m.297147 g.297147  ORF g.297147 m.297147 type:complete len:78 (-) comp20076_c0_seq2:9-242(-)
MRCANLTAVQILTLHPTTCRCLESLRGQIRNGVDVRSVTEPSQLPNAAVTAEGKEITPLLGKPSLLGFVVKYILVYL